MNPFKVGEKVWSTVCKRCGRDWGDVDQAVVCSDWDAVLGIGRHLRTPPKEQAK